jgi:hypothetical protein
MMIRKTWDCDAAGVGDAETPGDGEAAIVGDM